jgi:hypothetical protein
MKKIYLLGFSLLLVAALNAQVEIKRSSGGGVSVGSDISGTEVAQTVTEDGLHAYKYNVINTGTPGTFSVTRLRLVDESTWVDGLCWAPIPDAAFEGSCYGNDVMPTNPWSTPTSITLPTEGVGELICDIDSEGSGSELFRYYILKEGVLTDSLDLRVSYVSAIEEKEVVSVTTYPNPAVNQLTVKTTGLEGEISVRITDVLGKVVYNQEVNTPKKIDVSDFRNGVYLIGVYQDGQMIQNKRIVVKH